MNRFFSPVLPSLLRDLDLLAVCQGIGGVIDDGVPGARPERISILVPKSRPRVTGTRTARSPGPTVATRAPSARNIRALASVMMLIVSPRAERTMREVRMDRGIET